MGHYLSFISCLIFYSISIPDLIAFLPPYLFFNYWVDKLLILRDCKLPPRYDTSLNHMAINILVFAVILRVTAAVWIFSAPEIFPSRIEVYTSHTGIKYYYMD